MRAAKPKVARPRHRIFRKWRRGIRLIVGARIEQQIVDFLWVESRQAEIEIRLVEFLQFRVAPPQGEGLKIDQWILDGQEPIEEGSVPAESDA